MFAFALSTGAFAEGDTKVWSFISVPQADRDAMTADAENWKYDSSNDRFGYMKALNGEPALASGAPVSSIDGLLFTISADGTGNLRLGYKSDCCMWIADKGVITIPNRKAGEFIEVLYTTSKKNASRKFNTTNLTNANFASTGDKKTKVTGTGKVTADGDITLTADGALYVYSIAVGDSADLESGSGAGGGSTENPQNPTDEARGLNYMGATTINTPAAGAENTIWLSPDGNDATADGSEEKPYFDLQLAVNKALPGTTILMKAGTYKYDKRINIDGRNGTHDQYITLMCPDGRAVLDFSEMPYHAHSDNPLQGVRLTSSYWHFYKIDICNASDNGLLIERNKPQGGSASDILARTQDAHDNIIEFCFFYKNGDTGLQMKNLAEFNYVLNCDSYWNCDEENGDADGFAPKISVGDGNYFYGCRAWENSDDGYDVFFKKDGNFSDNKTIIFENCIAERNGRLSDGTPSEGNANGFKLGSNQGRMNVVLNRCLAIANGSKGFDQNHNSGDIIMNNCTGFTRTDEVAGKNVKYSYSYKIYEELASGSVCQLNNCVAINDNYISGKDQNGVDAKKGQSEWGGIRVDEAYATLTTSNLKADPTYFLSLDNYKELQGERQEDGSLPVSTFARINEATGAALIDKGTIIAENDRYESTGVKVPAIAYEGSAPDLGAYEIGLAEKKVSFGTATDTDGIGIIAASASNGRRTSLVQAFSGQVILSVQGATAADQFTVSAFDAAGKLLGRHRFNGTNTSIYLPNAGGLVLLKVQGSSLNETIKVTLK